MGSPALGSASDQAADYTVCGSRNLLFPHGGQGRPQVLWPVGKWAAVGRQDAAVRVVREEPAGAGLAGLRGLSPPGAWPQGLGRPLFPPVTNAHPPMENCGWEMPLSPGWALQGGLAGPGALPAAQQGAGPDMEQLALKPALPHGLWGRSSVTRAARCAPQSDGAAASQPGPCRLPRAARVGRGSFGSGLQGQGRPFWSGRGGPALPVQSWLHAPRLAVALSQSVAVPQPAPQWATQAMPLAVNRGPGSTGRGTHTLHQAS